MTKTFALVTPDTEHYDHVISCHRSAETADRALARKIERTLKAAPNAQVGIMYRIVELDSSPATSRIRTS
jgi:hypothetical protein